MRTGFDDNRLYAVFMGVCDAARSVAIRLRQSTAETGDIALTRWQAGARRDRPTKAGGRLCSSI
jgi:hypothetical protein